MKKKPISWAFWVGLTITILALAGLTVMAIKVEPFNQPTPTHQR